MSKEIVQTITHHSEAIKSVCDALSITCVIATLSSLLPPIAALATIIWTTIRIFETRTVKKWRGKDRRKKKK